MDPAEDLARKDPEEIRESIDATRAALNEKIEILGEQFRDTIQMARETVTEKVENIRETFSLKNVFRNRQSLSTLVLIGLGFYISRSLRRRLKRVLTP